MGQSLARSSPPRNTCTHPPTNRPTNQPTNRPPKLYFEARASSGYPPGPEFSILLTEEILQVKSAREWMVGVALGGIRSPPRPPKFQCCASPGASPNGGNVRKLKRAPHTFPNIEIWGAGGGPCMPCRMVGVLRPSSATVESLAEYPPSTDSVL